MRNFATGFLLIVCVVFLTGGILNGIPSGLISDVASLANQPDDPLLPDKTACPGQLDESAPEFKQEKVMLCVLNEIRVNAGLEKLRNNATLDLSARDKVNDIIECEDFSHTACGLEFSVHFALRGYNHCGDGCIWGAGENLAWSGEEKYSEFESPRSIANAWLHSPKHREALLSPTWNEIGLGMQRTSFLGQEAAVVWVTHFGYRRLPTNTERPAPENKRVTPISTQRPV